MPSSAIFTQSYRGTDAVITGKSAFDLSSNGLTTAPPFDESLLATVKALPDVKAAIGGVGGEAQLIGKNGKAIVFGGAPNLGFSVDPTQPAFNSLTLVGGQWPKPGEVVIDESTAGKKDITIGQQIGVQAQGPVEQFRVSGLVKFGSVATIGGATLAGFDLPTAQRLFDKTGKLDQIRVGAKSGVSPDQLTAEISAVLPPGTQVRSGNTQAAKRRKRHEQLHQLPADVPPFVRGRCALRRRLRHRQLALDHDRAAHPRVRDPAHARRLETTGAAHGHPRSPCHGYPRVGRRPLPRPCPG